MRVLPLATSSKLLAEMTPAARARLMPLLTPAVLTLGDVLFDAGAALRTAYFPLDCLVSLSAPIKEHASLEVAVVGNGGTLGVALALGLRKSPVRAVGQRRG